MPPTFESIPHLVASPAVVLVVGAVLLFWGSRLYHLLLGVVGFVAGWTLVAQLQLGGPPWLELAGALLLGMVGVVAAFLIQRLALLVAGVVIGGLAGLWAVQRFGVGGGEFPEWVPAIVGAVVGAILMQSLFRLGLIVLSSWVGAGLVLQALPIEGAAAGGLGLALLVIGSVSQMRGPRHESSSERKQTRRERKHRKRLDRRLDQIERDARRRRAAAG